MMTPALREAARDYLQSIDERGAPLPFSFVIGSPDLGTFSVFGWSNRKQEFDVVSQHSSLENALIASDEYDASPVQAAA